MGAQTIETIVYRTEKQVFFMPVVRTSDQDARAQLSHMIQIDCLLSARVPSHLVTTWMRLASDMRAQCAFDRSTLGVHIQGATAERGGAVGSRHPGARTGSDGSDEAARSSQVTTASV